MNRFTYYAVRISSSSRGGHHHAHRPVLRLTEPERQQLTQWARGRRTPARRVLRATMALLAAEGHDNQHSAAALDTSRQTVGLWRHRVAPQRLPGLVQDAPRGGRPPKARPALITRILKTTTQTTPPGATHWSTRTVARHLRTNPTFVQRVWTTHGLRPHRVRTVTLSQDPHFQDKLEDVVGLSLHPPEHAVVLCVDENSQIHALDRTQPGLPMKKGRCGTRTHDDKRHGIPHPLCRFSEGSLLATCLPRHRPQEWLTFLRLIDRPVPPGTALHLIADNYATHQHPTVQRWLTGHPRIHMHFTPTSSSWLNLVERVFGDLTANSFVAGCFAASRS